MDKNAPHSMQPQEKTRGLTGDALEHFRNTHFEDDYLLVDVRPLDTYETGHVPGALSAPFETLPAQTRALNSAAGRHLIFYCNDGTLAKQAAEWAANDLGHEPVAYLVGGIANARGLQLTGVPQWNAFDGATDIAAQLRRAFELEKATYRLYCSFVVSSPLHPASAALTTLVDTEKDHARSIHKLLRILSPHPVRDFEDLFEQPPSVDIVEGGISIRDVLRRRAELTEAEATGFLQLGAEIELAAYDLYKNLAQRALTVDARETFLELAQQEKGHVALVSRALSRARGASSAVLRVR
jgi:rubrerythrin